MQHHNIVMLITVIVSIAILVVLFGESFFSSKKKIFSDSKAFGYYDLQNPKNEEGVIHALFSMACSLQET